MGYLDDLDRKLLAELQGNAYGTYAELATRLGVSKTTVTRRTQRLLSEGVMRIIAVPDPKKLGLGIGALIGLNVELKSISSICDQLAARPEVQMVAVMAGRYDIVVRASFPSQEELSRFVIRDIARIDGVRGSETLLAMKVSKMTAGMTV